MKSLSEIVKKRKYLTEPEVRYYVRQMVGVLTGLREKNMIHRE